MADFFNAALPFVAIGLTIALLAANGRRGRKNYLTEGMCLGLALGVGLFFLHRYGLRRTLFPGRSGRGAGLHPAGGGPGPAGAQRREGI